MGAKEGLSHLALVMLSPGDVVFAPDPTYPIHPYAAIISGADVRRVPIGPGRNFIEDLQLAMRQTWPQPKLLVLSFPHNPTTSVVGLCGKDRTRTSSGASWTSPGRTRSS